MNAIKDSLKSGRTVVGTTGAPNVDVSILADARAGIIDPSSGVAIIATDSHYRWTMLRHVRRRI